jgi:serine/threonine protein kinase
MSTTTETPEHSVVLDGALVAGSRVDGYVIDSVAGRGGMATVYRVTLPELKNAEAAMKVPHPGLDAQWLEQFRREAELLFNMSNHHIVKPRAFGRLGDGRPYLVMEFHRANSLRAALDTRREQGESRMGVAEALRCAIQLTRGLGAAHAAGIIHRDLKPENILFDERETTMVSGKDMPTLRLSDFGLASRVGEAFTHAGTVDYLSPEQAAQRPPDARADLFSLGVVLYELLAGATPWASLGLANTQALLEHRMSREAPRLELVAPDVPHDIADLVHNLLAVDPAQRYQSATTLRNDLETRLQQLENRVERTHVNVSLAELQRRNASTDLLLPTGLARSVRRRRMAGVALLALLLLLLGWGLISFFTHPTEPVAGALESGALAVAAAPVVAAPVLAPTSSPDASEDVTPLPMLKPAPVSPGPRPVSRVLVEVSNCEPDADWKRSASADLDELTQRSAKRRDPELELWAAGQNDDISRLISVASTRGECSAIKQRLQAFTDRIKGTKGVEP